MPPKQPLWVLIREHLQACGGSDTSENILAALIEAGHELGRYPRRTVKQSLVSPHLSMVFAITPRKNGDAMVRLRKEGAKGVMYIPGKSRIQAAKRSIRPN
jgi:hypothetical protein